MQMQLSNTDFGLLDSVPVDTGMVVKKNEDGTGTVETNDVLLSYKYDRQSTGLIINIVKRKSLAAKFLSEDLLNTHIEQELTAEVAKLKENPPAPGLVVTEKEKPEEQQEQEKPEPKKIFINQN